MLQFDDISENRVTFHTPKRRTNATCEARQRDENVTVLKMIAFPVALAYVVALVYFGNDQIVCLKNGSNVARDSAWAVARAIALVSITSKIENSNEKSVVNLSLKVLIINHDYGLIQII